MFKQICFIAITAVLMISGCSSDGDKRRQEYLDADYYTRLEIPPDLITTVDKGQLNSPKPTDGAIVKFKQDTEHLGSEGTDKKVGNCK